MDELATPARTIDIVIIDCKRRGIQKVFTDKIINPLNLNRFFIIFCQHEITLDPSQKKNILQSIYLKYLIGLIAIDKYYFYC